MTLNIFLKIKHSFFLSNISMDEELRKEFAVYNVISWYGKITFFTLRTDAFKLLVLTTKNNIALHII